MITPKQYDTLTAMMDVRDKAVSDLYSETVDKKMAAYAFVEANDSLEKFLLSLVPDNITQDEADGWVKNEGKNIPLSGEVEIEAKLKEGSITRGRVEQFYWSLPGLASDIIAYRIV